MGVADFEARYRTEGDPWGYQTSRYEQAKYRATLKACGPGPFDSALELGGSIGIFSEMLAPRCRRLTTIDFAPSAVAAARERLRSYPQATVLLGEIPAALAGVSPGSPAAGPHDLVIASEILYYLEDQALAATLSLLERAMAPGGRLVAVHWIPPGSERPHNAHDVHAALRSRRWLEHAGSDPTAEYLLDVFWRR